MCANGEVVIDTTSAGTTITLTGSGTSGILDLVRNMTIYTSPAGTMVTVAAATQNLPTLFIAQSNTYVTIKNLILTSNTNQAAVAFTLVNGFKPVLQVTDCIVQNNKRAFINNGQGTLKINNTIIRRNTGINQGAGIYTKSNMELGNCTFTENQTTADGPAIYFEGTNPGAQAKIYDSYFAYNNNTGASGGAIYARNGTMLISGCTFENNVAFNQGGAIWIQTTGYVKLVDTHIKNCSTQTSWGGGN